MSEFATTSEGFSRIIEWRERLAGLIDRHLAAAEAVGLDGTGGGLARLRRRVASDDFKVLVIGEFKRGKSTLINALLGEKLLPSHSLSATAIINEIKYGDTPSAVVHFRARDGDEPEARAIAVDELGEYVWLKGREQSEFADYERVELKWPLELCRNGVQIIDSPGLNDDPERDHITFTYLEAVDAVLVIMSCDQLFSLSERRLVEETLAPSGHRRIFFVCNRINVVDEEEHDEVIEAGRKMLRPFTDLGDRGISFINAKGALDARMRGDRAAVAETGVPELERELERFLTEDRGKLKVLWPAQELAQEVHEVRAKRIPTQERMLELDLEGLEERVSAQREPIELARRERDLIVARMAGEIEDARTDALRLAQEFYGGLSGASQEWLAAYQAKNKVRAKDIAVSSRALREELLGHVTERIGSATAEWQQQRLQPLVDDRMRRLSAELEDRAAAFLAHVDEIRVGLGGRPVTVGDGPDSGPNLSPAERLLAAAGGWVVAGPGAALIGGTGGFRAVGPAMITQVALGIVGLTVLNLSLPAVSALMIASGLGKAWSLAATSDKVVRGDIRDHLVQSLEGSAYERADDVAREVEAALTRVLDAVRSGLDAELAQLHEQIDRALEDKRAGESVVRERRRELADVEHQLAEVAEDLTRLLTEVAAS